MKMKYSPEQYELDNGLNVILIQDDMTSIVTVKTIVNVGSIYESE